MKLVIIFLSTFLLSITIYAQQTDYEIVQTLISKYHNNIRVELNALGLTYNQKKQTTNSDAITRHIFFIDGTKKNTKIWEVFTKPINSKVNRVVRILIKYYYKNPGDIIEFDNFKIPDDQIVNGYFVTYEKSEGKKQAHIEINIKKENELPEGISKETKSIKVISDSNNNLYFQLIKKFKNTDSNLYYLNVFVKGAVNCAGLESNFIKMRFFSGEIIILSKDKANRQCNLSVVSSFSLNKEDIQKFETNLLSIIHLKQGENEYKTIIKNSDILMNMIQELNIE